MDTAQVDEKTKARKEKSRGAIALAMEGRWERAVTLNREILGLFPDDVDALNRLGKALLELGRYPASRDSFESALRISPHNTIAKKNLERLRHLEDSNSHPKSSKVVDSLPVHRGERQVGGQRAPKARFPPGASQDGRRRRRDHGAQGPCPRGTQ